MDNTQMKQVLDEIMTHLLDGEVWHRRSAAECRKWCVRGWGRWHDAEASCDDKYVAELTKMIGDIPTLHHTSNATVSHDALTYEMPAANSPEEFLTNFKGHHDTWREREKRFIATLNKAIKMACEFDTALYQKLLCLKKEVENEAFRVQLVLGRMWLTKWADIGFVSQVLHEYFECKYDGGAIDFNIG